MRFSTHLSSGLTGPSSMVKAYWKPEHPPPSTDSRSFSSAFPDLACSALIR
jgi:hypothetical protein